MDIRTNEEREGMQAMQRGKGRGVDNGLDRGRVDVFVDRGHVVVVDDDVDIGRPRQFCCW